LALVLSYNESFEKIIFSTINFVEDQIFYEDLLIND